MKEGNELSVESEELALPNGRAPSRSNRASSDYLDRMVPSRRSIEKSLGCCPLVKMSPRSRLDPYSRYLSQEMLQDKSAARQSIHKQVTKRLSHSATRTTRPAIRPYRAVRIEGWANEFYSSLLDWSYNNYIGLAVNFQVDVLNPCNEGSFSKKSFSAISSSFSSEVTSIKFSPASTKYAAGLQNGSLHIMDYAKNREVLSIHMLNLRISSLEWSQLVLFGGKNCEVYGLDCRSPLSVGVLHSGKSEVCGIKQAGYLVAVGSNNNSVVIYDIRKGAEIDKYYHNACVKALCWDRSGQNLFSGGGCTDRRILKWSFKDQAVVDGITTDSQVCNLVHSRTTDDIVACFGYPLNEISIWNSRKLARSAVFCNSKKGRILYAALNGSGEKLVTGNGQGDIEFWKPFNQEAEGMSPSECR